ncbi:MAG TPA: hypothetical protein VMU34_21535 [Mycobacterium sp.]|nr:hypothetical protein [Mycobacterium sp.]
MGVPVPLTGNVRDLSNYNGFQWAFYCNRCGNGLHSPYEQNVASRGKGLLRMAGQIFGGPVEDISQGVDDISMYQFGGEQSLAKDWAFTRAVKRVQLPPVPRVRTLGMRSILLERNLCRCATHNRIVRAVLAAAAEIRSAKGTTE